MLFFTLMMTNIFFNKHISGAIIGGVERNVQVTAFLNLFFDANSVQFFNAYSEKIPCG